MNDEKLISPFLASMRIASLSPAMTEILFGVEQGKNIVCTDQFSDHPDAAREIPHLKDHQKIDLVSLAVYKPDIVFTSTLVQAKLAEHLKEQGFTVIHQDPRSVLEVYDSIRQVGIILGCESRAESLIGMLQQELNDTKRKAAMLGKKPRVYIEEWHNPPMVAGNWVPEVVKLAGGIPLQALTAGHPPRAGILPAEQPAGDGRNPPSRAVSLQEVEAFDPDLIILSICGAGPLASKELLSSRAGWQDLRAVKENHLFVIDDNLLNRPGPRLAEGARRLFGWCFQVMH